MRLFALALVGAVVLLSCGTVDALITTERLTLSCGNITCPVGWYKYASDAACNATALQGFCERLICAPGWIGLT